MTTGVRPAAPPIPGLDQVPFLTSTTAPALDRLPRSLLVIGGGYLGCELGRPFARIGVKVAPACRSRLIPGAEPKIGDALAAYFSDEGMMVRNRLVHRHIRNTDTGVVLEVADHGSPIILGAEQVLVAAGRRPNTEGLGLDKAGVALLPNGGIQTAVLTIEHGLSVADLAGTILPNLTTVEGLKLAALAFEKDVAKLSCCAG